MLKNGEINMIEEEESKENESQGRKKIKRKS
jgi:hypothetical protein